MGSRVSFLVILKRYITQHFERWQTQKNCFVSVMLLAKCFNLPQDLKYILWGHTYIASFDRGWSIANTRCFMTYS